MTAQIWRELPRRTSAEIVIPDDDGDDGYIPGLQTCDVCDAAYELAAETAREQGRAVVLYDADGDWWIDTDGQRTPYVDPESI